MRAARHALVVSAVIVGSAYVAMPASATSAARVPHAATGWGDNQYGQLGTAAPTSQSSSPVQVNSATWSAVATGSQHACGLQTSGTLSCWGANDHGQLGLGNKVDRGTPTQIGTEATWSSVTAGGAHSCALR